MRVVLTLLLLAWAAAAEAKTFCVNAGTGSDATAYASLNASTCTATLTRALAVALAGDRVEVAAGIYSAAGVGSRWPPAFNSGNSGTSGNPITYVAMGVVDLRLSSSTGPIMGCSSRDYITWSGPFLVDEANGTSAPDTGPVVMHDSTACIIDGASIDGNGVGHAAVDNHPGVRIEACDDCELRNTTVTNVDSNSSNDHNGACVQTYLTQGGIIEHNNLNNCGAGIFVKGGPWSAENRGLTIRYNLIHDMLTSGIAVHAGAPSASATPTLIYQNIVYNAVTGLKLWWYYGIDDTNDPRNTHYVNNTVDQTTACIEFQGEPYPTNTTGMGITFVNNICSRQTNGISDSTGTTIHQDRTQIAFDHTIYYSTSGTNIVLGGGSPTVTYANWQLTPYFQDATSPALSTSDPQFTNTATRDYTLTGGSFALTHGRVVHSIGGTNGATIPAGAFITGSETIGVSGAATVPDAPTIGTAVPGNAQATVAFTAPADDGGSTITGYTATSTPGSFTSSGCTASPCTVPGLTNGVSYTFVVYATNAEGNSANSAASNSVTPSAGTTIGGRNLRLRGQQ